MSSATSDTHYGITEIMIHELVREFYVRIRAHEELGPIFDRAIGHDWDAHLTKMCDFWSSVVLRTGRFKGAPMLAHMRLKMVRPHHFEQWLTLFRATALSLFPPAIASIFIDRAQTIARSLQLGMFFQPGLAAAGPTSAMSNRSPS